MTAGQLRAYGLVVLTLPLYGLHHLTMLEIDDGNNMQNNARLKIWVCEFVSAGGLAHVELPASLLQEGLLMRDALLHDLHALGVDCITSHDYRVPAPEMAYSQQVTADTADVMAQWQQQIVTHAVDACWVIAPETDGILQQLQAMVMATGRRWIGCDDDAIRIASDKALMAQHCAAAGMAVIPHQRLQDVSLETHSDHAAQHGWIVKPLDGAGCEHTYHFKNIEQVIDFKESISRQSTVLMQRLLLQPYLQGQALSFSAIASMREVRVVAAHQQHITITNNILRFDGASVNAAAYYLPAMQVLAEQLKALIPGLTGYWGADVLMQADGRLLLVEINPRLTTPYIALSALLDSNPAQLVLDAVLRQQLPQCVARGQQHLLLNAPIHEAGLPC